jgi:hypothetical protein
MDPAPTAVARKTPALLIGGYADSCLFLRAGCLAASVARLQPRGRRHEPVGLLLQLIYQQLPPLLPSMALRDVCPRTLAMRGAPPLKKALAFPS